MTDARSDALDELLVRQEVIDVLVQFCCGVDRQDRELLRDCFHPDATDDHGMFQGGGHDFVDYVLQSGKTMLASSHQITNVTVRRRGNEVFSEAYVTVAMRMPRGTGGMADHLIFARYVDRFTRLEGRLRIADRRVVYDLTRIDPVGGEWSLGDSYLRGARTPSDVRYEAIPRGGGWVSPANLG